MGIRSISMRCNDFPCHVEMRDTHSIRAETRKNLQGKEEMIVKKLRKIDWIQVGAKQSFAELVTWFGDGKDRKILKRKLLILGGVCAGVVLVSVQIPTVGPIAFVMLILGVFAWYGIRPGEEMTMRYADFAGSIQIGDKAYPSMEILRKYIEAHPGEDAAQLARRLSEAPGSPKVSPRLMKGVMRELGLDQQPPQKKEEGPEEKVSMAKD